MASFEEACALVEIVLTGSVRQEMVTEVAHAADLRAALLRLRDSMRSHAWKAGAHTIALGHALKAFDARTRDEGFHVLHDWDGKADTVNEDIIPVDVLHYLIDARGAEPADRTVIAVLVDYYFLHLLTLLSLRIWDEGDADDNLDRLDRLLRSLQGPGGSGQRFVDDGETLMLIATSHFELHDRGYAGLLARAKTLNQSHRTKIALGHAASMASHLRFGFEATYARDTIVMRNDNVADYPWLCFALLTLMREYEHVLGSDRDRLVEAILNGLTADARGEPPASLSTCEAERSEFRDRFQTHRDRLIPDFERHRPSDRHYSPLSFFFNFSHNILKGTVVDALLRSVVWDVSFNDLLTGIPRDAPIAQEKERLATTLMAYARSNPDTIRGRPMPVIVYDPQAGHQAFTVTMRKLRS